MIINLKKGDYAIKQVKVGFSWTIFFFGGLPLLFRSMYGHFIIVLLTFGLASFYYMFAGNRIYIKKLLEAGFEPVDEISATAIKMITARWSYSHAKGPQGQKRPADMIGSAVIDENSPPPKKRGPYKKRISNWDTTGWSMRWISMVL